MQNLLIAILIALQLSVTETNGRLYFSWRV